MNNFNKIWLYIIIFFLILFAPKISEPHAAIDEELNMQLSPCMTSDETLK